MVSSLIKQTEITD